MHGENVTGLRSAIAGNGMKVDDSLRDVKVEQNDLSLVNMAETKGAGKIRIIGMELITVRVTLPSPQSDLSGKPRSPM